MKETPIPYISNDKLSQEDIFDYWVVCLSWYDHVNLENTMLFSSQLENNMIMSYTGNTSSLQCQEVGRRKGSKEVL
jgi:hypothetical protein